MSLIACQVSSADGQFEADLREDDEIASGIRATLATVVAHDDGLVGAAVEPDHVADTAVRHADSSVERNIVRRRQGPAGLCERAAKEGAHASDPRSVSSWQRLGSVKLYGTLRDRAENIEEEAIVGALAAAWRFEAASLEYLALGAGSYHWLASADDGTRRFVTVDDLDGKLWLGDTRESVRAGLGQAFDTARVLCDHGLTFVAAPIATSRGKTLRPLGPRHAVALFPFVDGETTAWGEHSAEGRMAVLELLARLHGSTQVAASTAATAGLQIGGRRLLEAALQEIDRPWAGGPFSEPAREALARHASAIAELLALADRFSADVARRGTPFVVTHGEPHPGNVIQTGGGFVLVDWDTVALAPPERDLWLVAGEDMEIYERATGHELDDVAVDFFTLAWDLKDLAENLHALRSEHRRSEDAAFALEFVQNFASTRDRWASFLA